ncbi:MAG: MATE family efflux transporter [Lachnospiraceae bacterium]|nr:MATE family efflux transporter [Lachnospiraceae bacterium]
MKLFGSEKKFELKTNMDLTQGSISGGILRFCVPIFISQLFQQLYNLGDAWVIGHYAEDEAFAAVSSAGSIMFFFFGFFAGVSVGGGVVISRYYGAKNTERVTAAIHTNFLFGLLASVFCTIAGTLLVPGILNIMATPADVMPYSLTYLRILFLGISANIMYNMCTSIMRSVGDSVSPLIYLTFSAILNVALDCLFVIVFSWGVSGAAFATVVTQFVSVILCIVKMRRAKDFTRLEFGKLKWHGDIMKEVIVQGIPNGIQNSVISIGNMTVQKNINAFQAAAMSGMGAYQKIEGLVFLPINCISMALPTFISQNLGAKKFDRAKKGAAIGIFAGMIMAEIVGVLIFFKAPAFLRLFEDNEAAIEFGTIHSSTVSLAFFLLAFSHCAAGVMRGCGKSVVPMATMLAFWCGVRVAYVTIAVEIWPVFRTVSLAYPITWTLSSIVFFCFLMFSDWTHTYEKKR